MRLKLAKVVHWNFLIIVNKTKAETVVMNTEFRSILTMSLFEGLDGGGGGVWNSLISKNLTHYSLSLKFLLIL